MNGKCFEIGTIQAFLDGETQSEVSLRVTNHIAACDRCARLLAEAEEETSTVFSVLDREMNALVPTQRLWNRINETIAEERNRTSVWQRFLSFASVYLASPSFAVAAGVLIFVGLFAAVWIPGGNGVSDNMVQIDAPGAPGPAGGPIQFDDGRIAKLPSEPQSPVETTKAAIRVDDSNLSPKKLTNLVINANNDSNQHLRALNLAYRTPVAAPEYLPGEESYVKTIAELRQNVEGQTDTVLTPSSRVSYERDMAVVEDSIKKMKQVVRKNPKNQAARQVLYAAYQDKIDLLNSVAQREDLIASLR